MFSIGYGAKATVLDIYGYTLLNGLASVLCRFQRLVQSRRRDSDELEVKYKRGDGRQVGGC